MCPLQRRSLLLLSALALGAWTDAQTPVYVDAAATGASDGSSWSDAFTDLQDALALPSASEIWVAAGTYYPAPAGDQDTSFALRSGLALYGGFAGTETALSQRDPAANPTILSGDINQDDTYGAFINWWQFGWNNNAGNSHHIVTATGVDATAVLDGFTIFAGLGDTASFVGGAGMYNLNADPTVRNCLFEKNAYGRGSALFNDASSPTIEGCVIKDGYTFGQRASGMYSQNASFPVVTDTVFDNHYTVATMGMGGGSAVYIGSGCDGYFAGCTFSRNQTGNWFAMGDPSGAFGAGIYHYGDTLWVESCSFTDNFSHAGSGIFSWQDATVINSLFARNRVVGYPVNPVVTSGDYGAGIATYASGAMDVIGCTVVDNEGHEGAGITGGVANPITLRDSVVWGNWSPPPLPGEDPVWILKQNVSGNVDSAYSCVEALLLTEPGEDPPDPANFPGCHDLDPQFVDFTGGDYRLSAGSPCIDAGDNGAFPPAIALDLDGNARFFDDPATPDTGLGTAPIVDMGAYELGGAAPLAEVVPYGCGINPAGSLSLVSGLPQLGTTVVLGIDNPLGTQAPGSLPFLGLAVTPAPGFPCGVPVPGFGMSGPGAVGELLIAVTAPNPFQVLGGSPWAGAGVPAPIAVPIPNLSSLLGVSVYAQGVLLDLSPSAAVPIGMAGAVELRIGT